MSEQRTTADNPPIPQFPNSPIPNSQISLWPDRLRILSTLMVIVIHTSSPIAHAEGSDYNGSWWWAGNFWNSLTRPAVPLFVMLSGYLLLGKDYELGGFLKKRFSRVAVPALFWMLIYSLYNFLANGSPTSIGEALKGIVTGPVHYHLWFLYLIIGLYLVYPILRPWVRSASDRDFLYFFAMCAFCTWSYKPLAMFFQMPIGIYFELFTNNCGYFVLGYYLGTRVGTRNEERGTMSEERGGVHSSSFTVHRYLPLGLIALGTVSTMLGSYWLNTFSGDDLAQVYFYDYLTPNVAISAIGWFLLAKAAFNSRPLLDVERDFAAASFGVYFIHVLVMDWWGKSGYWHSMAHPGYVAPILAALIASMSFVAVSLLRVLPGGKRVT